MACLLLCVTILTAVEILLAAISEDTSNTNNNSTESRKSYAFICLIFTFFMRERLSRVHTFALCVNMLFLEFWHVRLVSCSLHCLLLLRCSDKLCNSSYPLLSKEKDAKLRGSRENMDYG